MKTPEAAEPESQVAKLARAVLAIEKITGSPRPMPKVGLVLGSGLSKLSDEVSEAIHIASSDIPGLPGAGVVGHKGELVFGKLLGTPVACLSGRAHLYEGHPASRVVFGVRLLAHLGVKHVILTNAAGGIAPSFGPGTLMLLSDHLNLTGTNPLCGKNEESLGVRFPDMSEVYSQELRELAKKVAQKRGIALREGVYAGLLGPSYETPAEIRMLETLGASAVGMSTVLEAIALRHMQVPVLGLSCITNSAAGKSTRALDHSEVAEVAGRTSTEFCAVVAGVCEALGSFP